MGWFKPKYLYRVVWAYDSDTKFTYTEYVKAADAAEAWHKIAKQHYAIDCREVTKVSEDNRIC